MSKGRTSILRRLRDEERGQALIFVAVGAVALFAIAGFAIDTAQTLQLRRELQASTDAAALAAAQFLPNSSAAVAAANSYSSVVTGGVIGKNGRPNHPTVTMVSGYPLPKCIVKPGYPDCEGGSNVIVVQQTSDVPTFFSRVIGRNSLTIRANAAALMKGGIPQPLDVIVILDTTSSMDASPGAGCTAASTGVSSPRRIDCAKTGMRKLLEELWPCADTVSCGAIDANGHVANAVDEVGLMVFPGVSVAAIPKHLDCSMNLLAIATGEILTYAAATAANFTIVPLRSDYKLSRDGALNGAGSKLVKASDPGHGAGCAAVGYVDDDSAPFRTGYGLEAEGGASTFYASTITASQAALAAGRPGVQKAMIILGDGAVNINPAPSSPNACVKAVNAADAAAAANTWVYSIAYGATNSSACSGYTELSLMQALASDASKFFNQPTAGDLTDIFQHIVLDLTTTRLVDE